MYLLHINCFLKSLSPQGLDYILQDLIVWTGFKRGFQHDLLIDFNRNSFRKRFVVHLSNKVPLLISSWLRDFSQADFSNIASYAKQTYFWLESEGYCLGIFWDILATTGTRCYNFDHMWPIITLWRQYRNKIELLPCSWNKSKEGQKQFPLNSDKKSWCRTTKDMCYQSVGIDIIICCN